MSGIEKSLFRIEIARLRDRGVIKPPKRIIFRTKNIYQIPEACVFCARETRTSNNGIPR